MATGAVSIATMELSEAIQRADVDAARMALAQGGDANGWMPVHETFLLAAASNGTYEIVDMLLEAGANPLATDRDQQNIYHKLAKGIPLDDNRRARIVQRLKDVGPDPDDGDSRGKTALHIAAVNDLSSTIHALVTECGASLDLPDYHGDMPTHLAAQKGKCDALYGMLLLGADMHATDGCGRSVVKVAEAEGQEGSQRELRRYAAYAEVELPDEPDVDSLPWQNPKLWKQADALMDRLEAQGKQMPLDRLLEQDADKRTPLHYAYLCGAFGRALQHVMAHHPIGPKDLRDEKGQLTSLAQMAVASGQCSRLFEPQGWKGRNTGEMRAVYEALPPEGQRQVPTYHQLYQAARQQAARESIGR
jgi:hypothetical protein